VVGSCILSVRSLPDRGRNGKLVEVEPVKNEAKKKGKRRKTRFYLNTRFRAGTTVGLKAFGHGKRWKKG